MDRIMVPLDGSRLAEHAIPPAISLAARSGAAVDLVHVEEALPHRPTARQFREEWAETYLRDVATRIRAADEHPSISRTVLPGRALQTLVDHAMDSAPDLVCMATHGHGPLTRTWLGSVTDGFLRSAQVPVLVVRPTGGSDGRPGLAAEPLLCRALVALDGSEESEAVLAEALELACHTHGSFVLLRVVELFPLDDPSYVQGQERDAREWADRTCLRVMDGGFKAEAFVRPSTRVAEEIVGIAVESDCDLIVVGSHGRGGVPRVLIGSVSDKVVRSADVPVLVVPTS